MVILAESKSDPWAINSTSLGGRIYGHHSHAFRFSQIYIYIYECREKELTFVLYSPIVPILHVGPDQGAISFLQINTSKTY